MKKANIYDMLVKRNINIEKDVFEYGISVLKSYITILAVLIPLSLLFDIFIENVIFLILFILLRKYLGGFHFNNNLLCFVFSVTISLFVPFISHYLHFDYFWIFIISIFDFFIILYIGPIDHVNKRMTYNEKTDYKHKAIMLGIFYSFLIASLYYMNFFNTSFLIFYTMTFNIISVIIAFIIQKW